MGTLGNTPRRHTILTLEAAKSFAFGMQFRTVQRDYVDLTDCTVRFVMDNPQHLGGATLLDVTSEDLDPVLGLTQFNLQALDLDRAPGSYPFCVVLVSQHGYSTVILKGEVEILENTDIGATAFSYEGINPSTNMAVYMENGGMVEVVVESLDGMYVQVSELISDTLAQFMEIKTEVQVLRDETVEHETATEGYRDEAQLILDQVQEISGISGEDAAIAYLLGNLGSLTFSALQAVLTSFLAGGDNDTYHDDWNRSDRDLRGDRAPSGHLYFVQNDSAGSCMIEDGQMLSIPPEGETSIAMIRMERNVQTVLETFGFRGSVGTQNRVCGFFPESFGNLSLQLASYASPSGLNVHLNQTGLTWSLFSVYDPPGGGAAEYESIACNLTHGELLDGFEVELEKPYVHGMARYGTSSVILTLIDGTTRVITDPRIAEHGTGTGLGLQERASSVDVGTTFGINVVATSAAATPQPYTGAPAVFDGTPYNSIQTAKPVLTSDDTDITFSVETWALPSSAKVMSRYEGTGNRSDHAGLSGAGSLQYSYYQGDVIHTATAAGDTVPPGNKVGRITRDATTGDVKFYTAVFDEDRTKPLSDPAWELLRTRTVIDDGLSTGAMDTTLAPLRLVNPTGGEAEFVGTLRYFAMRDGIDGDIVAERDFIGTEPLGRTDSAGNDWIHIGEEWEWKPIQLPPPAASAFFDFGPCADEPFDLDPYMKTLVFRGQASGGSGGSGRRGAAGTVRCGGGGGAAGGHTIWAVDAQELWDDGVRTIYLDVGAGQTGGAAVTTDNTNGNPGAAGQPTRVKTAIGVASSATTILSCTGGAAGSGGTATDGSGGGASTGQFAGGAGRSASTNGGTGSAALIVNSAPSGGGAGGGIQVSGDTANPGSDGGPAPGALQSMIAAGGAAGGTNGGDGWTPTYGAIYGGSGAGGGASKTSSAGRGGHGGRGAGGGGGGASLNGFDSGAGGNSGDGRLTIEVRY